MVVKKAPVREREERETRCPKCGAMHSAAAGCGGKKRKK